MAELKTQIISSKDLDKVGQRELLKFINSHWEIKVSPNFFSNLLSEQEFLVLKHKGELVATILLHREDTSHGRIMKTHFWISTKRKKRFGSQLYNLAQKMAREENRIFVEVSATKIGERAIQRLKVRKTRLAAAIQRGNVNPRKR